MSKNENLMENGSFWLPEAASDFAKYTDGLFSFIFWGSTIIFILLMLAALFFIFMYVRTPKNLKAAKQVTHNNLLEVVWTVIPLILVGIVFYWGFKGFIKMAVPPDEAYEIRVIGQKWNWLFEYPKEGIKVLNDLVVPVDTPIKLVMSSKDVIHSFYIPNMRVKRDVLPNRYTQIWFKATRTGNFQVFCTEYCGDGHSIMLANLKVLPGDEFDKWLVEGQAEGSKDIPLDQLGQKLYTDKGCNACHSLDGSNNIGPSWLGLYGVTRQFTDGTTGKADDNYIRASIVNPAEKIVAGYQPVMPTYSGLLSDREINAIIEYIKTLK